ncbi:MULTISPECIES: hypothetical protein [Rhodococcus]|uniref:hypothetical protein n=1 Tax=Rhodococcus TaxID=1827 RepID=UPI001CF91F26|nr:MULTISPECIES: hypothetical protein [Rhodococcus]
MVPIFRSLISIPAGVTRMSLGQFVVFTAAQTLALGIVVTVLVVAVVRRVRSRRGARDDP